MTRCVMGDHQFPDEDDTGARCDEHGVTLLWHGPPITPEDFTPEPLAPRATRPTAPAQRALSQHSH
ncbi:hypothetical protein [Streptomyces sp. NPDC002994]|uniref:hypothetical protein n=1 Tax=Streptomyces sp. NPDC002994 TaxID=3154441 RepID=UPI0033A3E065